jgi:tRNA(Ile)-lysidine synthase
MIFDQLQTVLSTNCQIKADLPVLAGVSGGPDSLVLFHLLKRLGYQVIPAHFDHLLRVESTREAEQLEKMILSAGGQLVRGSGDVQAYAENEKMSIEEAARVLRYRFLFEQARKHGAQAVITAHTADDQVETVLMHILRGSGPGGLSGMACRQLPNPWDARISLARPLLDVWRKDILAYCKENALEPVMDESNANNVFLRNRIRNVLIPELEQSYNPQVKRAIIRLAKTLREETEIVDQALETGWGSVLVDSGDGYLRFNSGRLLAQPVAMRRLLLRRAVSRLTVDSENAGYDVIQRALDYVQHPGFGKEADLVEGLLITAVERDVLIFRAESNAWLAAYPQIDAEVLLPPGGDVALGEKWVLRAGMPAQAGSQAWETCAGDPNCACIDLDRISLPLIVRAGRPGERFQPLGMGGKSIKLSDFFTNEKIPRRARAGYPLIFSGDQIVWAPGYRLAHPFRVTESTQTCLTLRLTRR